MDRSETLKSITWILSLCVILPVGNTTWTQMYTWTIKALFSKLFGDNHWKAIPAFRLLVRCCMLMGARVFYNQFGELVTLASALLQRPLHVASLTSFSRFCINTSTEKHLSSYRKQHFHCWTVLAFRKSFMLRLNVPPQRLPGSVGQALSLEQHKENISMG